MSAGLDAALARLAKLLDERVGLHIRADNLPSLRLALAARLQDGPTQDPEGYVARLEGPDGGDELRRLLPLVTVGKTSFFRDEGQFVALRTLLPRLVAEAEARGGRISIWSAGCATGEEPWSLALTFAEAGVPARSLELVATDVNPEAVAATLRGHFTARRMRDVPETLRARWFDEEAGGYTVKPALREYLREVRAHNLAAPVYPRPAGTAWDVVFCRNVIIYFDTQRTQQVLSRIHAVLRPGGHLFLGYSESLFRIFDGFELAELGGAFLYRKPSGPRARPAPPPPIDAAPARYAPPGPVVHEAPPRPPPPGRPAPPEPPSPQEELDRCVAAIDEGRFEEARDRLVALLQREPRNLAARLTYANLSSVLREPIPAEAAYLAAIETEPLCAEAHLFHGIFRLGRGETDRAAEELGRALFLDPDLALAHYYLGRCREQQRDPNRARLGYRNAMEAFRREPKGRRQRFLGYYPDLPEDGSAFARAAEYALAKL